MKFKLITSLALFSAVIGFTSCIKDKYTIEYDEANLARPIVEFTNSPLNRIGVASAELSTPMVELDLGELRIAPRSQYSGNITVTLKKDTAAVSSFIAAQDPVPPIVKLNPNAYSLVTTNYTLNSTGSTGRVKILINSALIPTSQRVAIGVTIDVANGAEISGLYKSIVLEVKAKSPYEGTYAATGTRTNYAGPTVAAGVASVLTIDETKFLATVDPNTVDGFMGDLAFVPFYYSLQVNTSTNAVTVLPSIANPSDTPGGVMNTGPCSYNPMTKTFTLNFQYINGVGNLRILNEVLVKQ
jgi:hypothetical protein